MSGETDHEILRRKMAPHLHPETFVYCCFPDFQIPAGLTPVCTFREVEGITAIVEKEQAVNADVAYVFESNLITLTVHSSLEAVGFLATLAGRLAEAEIPCNVVAGYHHDHLFVPVRYSQKALKVLAAIAESPEPPPTRPAV